MAPKRRQLDGFVGIHGISDQALAAVLTRCKETPIEDGTGTSRRSIYRTINKSYEAVESDIKLHMCGRVWDWKIARLDKMMTILCAESSNFRFIIRKALENSSGHVLELISYLDEVVVGNPLSPENHRKIWAIYITCKDLPQWMLQLEDCWMCVAVIRTGIASEIDGNVSSCMRCLFEHFIRDCSMSIEEGVTLQLK